VKAVKAIYEKGEIKPLEPVPDVESAEVLVIFPDVPPLQRGARPPLSEEELFGCGQDWWTNEVDAAIRESFIPRRPGHGLENNGKK